MICIDRFYYYFRFVSLTLVIFCSFAAYGNLPEAPKKGQEWIVDEAKIMTSERIARINRQLKELEQTTGHSVAVLVVNSLQGRTVEEFGIKLAESWKIGSVEKSDGVIFIVALEDRKLRIEVGRGLEGVLTDAFSSRIIREIVTPTIKISDIPSGVEIGVDAIVAVVSGKGFPEASSANAMNSLKEQESKESESDENGVDGLKLPEKWHKIAVVVFVFVMLLLSLAILFQNKVTFYAGTFVLAGFTGIFLNLMTNLSLCFFGVILYGILVHLIRYFVGRSERGARLINSSSSGSYSSESDSSTDSSSSSSSRSSSSSSSSSSRGGSYGGGGASGDF